MKLRMGTYSPLSLLGEDMALHGKGKERSPREKEMREKKKIRGGQTRRRTLYYSN